MQEGRKLGMVQALQSLLICIQTNFPKPKQDMQRSPLLAAAGLGELVQTSAIGEVDCRRCAASTRGCTET